MTLTARAQTTPSRPPDYHLAELKFRSMTLRDENGKIPPNALIHAVQQKRQMPFIPQAWPGVLRDGTSGGLEPATAGIDSASWTSLGPGNIGGRIRSVLIHPTDPNIIWVGGVDGGIWKTLNGGTNWFPLDDFMANLAVVSLVMDPTDTNTIYAGTGEGTSNADAIRGAGIFKSTDGGSTWTQLPSTTTSSFYYVNRLAICPTNRLILLAATGSGIWRTTDGGTSWSQRYSSAATLDIAFNPADGGKCIASGSTYGVAGMALYSIDGGVTWLAGTGVSTAGRIEVAYAPSSPNLVYASANNNSGEVYLSTDGGQTYALKSTGYDYLGGQGWYDNCVWVDPTNPNFLIVGGIDLWRSTDGGSTFTQISQWRSAPLSAHADHHAIVNSPAYDGVNNKTVYFGNDGGIYRAADVSTVSLTSGWTFLNHNLGITQFYGAAGNNSSGTIVGGTQDNGTLRDAAAGGTSGWTAMFGGDGGFCAADQSDPNYFYGEYVYLQIHRSSNAGLSSSYITTGLGDAGIPGVDGSPYTKGGDGDPDGGGPDGDPDVSANFIAPFILDPNNYNTMLAGGNNLWRSTNVKAATPTWLNIKPGSGSYISAIAVAPGNSDIIWVGHNNGDVFATANGTAASPTWTRKDLGTPNLPNRVCTRLTIDTNNYNVVYATFGGFSADNVYRTTDGGTTWANISGGLPSAPVRSLVLAPFNSSFLYVGTDVGVFASDDGGASWSPGNVGAANVSVDELFWMGRYLVAATHGRGLFKILVSPSPVINLVSATLASENCPPGNGVIDPDESVTVNFTLTNVVSLATANLTATLLAGNGVVSPSAAQNYGALAAGGAAVTRAFTFMATGQCGGTITAVLQLADGATNLGTVSATFPLGIPNTAPFQNFDGVAAPALPAGWTVSLSGVGAAWTATAAVNDTPPNSAFAPDTNSISDNLLTSPVFMVSGASAQVIFRHNYNTETTFDGGVLEISINGGAFTDILTAGGSFVANGYTQTISTFYSSPIGGRQAWSGNSGGFVTTTVNLPAAAAGQAVQLRWRFASDNSYGAVGWYIDSISLKNGYQCCTGTTRPVFQSISWTNNTAFLTWMATAGVTYRLQYNTNLATTNWIDVAGDVLAGGSLASKTDVYSTNRQKFYRLRQLP